MFPLFDVRRYVRRGRIRFQCRGVEFIAIVLVRWARSASVVIPDEFPNVGLDFGVEEVSLYSGHAFGWLRGNNVYAQHPSIGLGACDSHLGRLAENRM